MIFSKNLLQGHLRWPLARPFGLKRHFRRDEAFKVERDIQGGKRYSKKEKAFNGSDK